MITQMGMIVAGIVNNAMATNGKHVALSHLSPLPAHSVSLPLEIPVSLHPPTPPLP